MYFLYRILSYGALPFVLLRILYKGRKLPAYNQRLSERFGKPKFSQISNSLWVHAVSVGETKTAIPLVIKLKESFPQFPIVFTTTTPTGSEEVQKTLNKQVFHSYLPYDISFAINKFIAHINPLCAIIMETEIWPNLFQTLKKKNIPIFIANARLSPSSFKRYLKIKGFISKTLSNCTNILAQNKNYADKYIALGAHPKKVIVTGNIKFDIPLSKDKIEQGQKIKKQLFKDVDVWIGSSTHEGEESVLLKIYLKLLKKHKNLKLILVPRHPERFSQVFDLCRSIGLSVHRRSKGLYPKDLDFHVYLGDSMGEMMMYYAMSDIAFVGGSLVKIGGHNLLEPAALGLPILTGPYLFNFKEIADLLMEKEGIIVVDDPLDMEEKLSYLLTNQEHRKEMGEASKQVVLSNKGALEKTLNIIRPVLEQYTRRGLK